MKLGVPRNKSSHRRFHLISMPSVVYKLYFTIFTTIFVCVCALAPSTECSVYVCVCGHFFRLAIMNFESDLSIYLGVCCCCCCCGRRFFSASSPPLHSPLPFLVTTSSCCNSMRLIVGYCVVYIVGSMRRPSLKPKHKTHTAHWGTYDTAYFVVVSRHSLEITDWQQQKIYSCFFWFVCRKWHQENNWNNGGFTANNKTHKHTHACHFSQSLKSTEFGCSSATTCTVFCCALLLLLLWFFSRLIHNMT